MSNTNTGKGRPYDAPSAQKVEQFNDILRALGLSPVDVKDGPKYTLRKEGTQVEHRTQQDRSLDSVRNGMFIIGSVDALGAVSFASNPMVHADATTARAECKRLAGLNPGKAFIFVKLSGAELVPSQRSLSI